MAKIPFDIKFRPQIESGEYKVEFGGKPARIICWDKKRSKDVATLVALIDDGESEHTEYFFSDGLAVCPTAPALYIITPEPELTEWQTFISGCLQKYGLLDCGAADRIAKECSAELLDLTYQKLKAKLEQDFFEARQDGIREGIEVGKTEALKEFEEKYKQSWFNEGKIAGRYEGLTEDKKYQQGVYDGKEEALKDLPRWKKAKEYIKLGLDDFCFTLDNDGKMSPYWDTEIEKGQYYITESDLENLPKEDEK